MKRINRLIQTGLLAVGLAGCEARVKNPMSRNEQVAVSNRIHRVEKACQRGNDEEVLTAKGDLRERLVSYGLFDSRHFSVSCDEDPALNLQITDHKKNTSCKYKSSNTSFLGVYGRWTCWDKRNPGV